MSFDFKNCTPEERKRKYNEIAKKIGDDQFFTKKELNYLPEILKDGEQVLAFTSRLMDGHTWLLVLTDQRLIFLDKGMLYGLKQEIMNLSVIQSVGCSTGILFGTINITHSSKSVKIENVWKKNVKLFTNVIQEQMDLINNPNMRHAVTTAKEEDKYNKLEKLHNLKERGIITEEEFNKKKTLVIILNIHGQLNKFY